MWPWPQLLIEKKRQMEYSNHHDDFVMSEDDDQIGRATSCEEWLNITIVNSGTRKDSSWNWRPDWRSTRSFPSLWVHLTNVTNQRPRTLVETDWTKFIFLIMSSLSNLWFYVTSRDRGSNLSNKSCTELYKLINYSRDEYWIEPCAHTSSSDSSDPVDSCDQIETRIRL